MGTCMVVSWMFLDGDLYGSFLEGCMVVSWRVCDGDLYGSFLEGL